MDEEVWKEFSLRDGHWEDRGGKYEVLLQTRKAPRIC